MPFIAPIVAGIGSALGSVASFIGGLGAFGKLALSIGLNLAASALTRKKNARPEPAGVQVQTQYGTDTPRQVACGLVGLAGQDCYINTYGSPDNKYAQWVFQVSDFYCDGLSRVAINGEWVTLDRNNPHPERGWPVTSGDFAGIAFVKWYDGTQTTADPNLVEEANPADRWTAAHKGVGCAYVVVTLVYDAEKTVGLPELFFEVRGARLYDWRKDSSVGGSGSHRWNDQSTWEFTENPIVMDYNYRRGLAINGDLFCGMQMDPGDLPLDRYTVAANICDELAGGEPRYRCSILLDCTATHGDNIEALMKSCGGVVIDAVDGSWPMVGAAQPIVATITDDDLVIGEPVLFQAKRSMSELVNSISGTRPDPDQLWAMVGYDAVVSNDAIIVDRRTRDLGMDFPTVRSSRQAKQLASIYLKENRLEATAELTARPRWQMLRAGDWIRWNSQKYGDRTYIVTEATLYSLDSAGPRNKRLVLQERNAAIYDGVSAPSIIVPYPPGKPIHLQEVQNFQLAAITAGSGDKLMPAIHASWAGIEDVTVIGVEIEWWPVNQPAAVNRMTVPDDVTLAVLVEGIVSSTEYAVRTRLVTLPRRTVAWSAPKTTTTLNQPITDVYPVDLDRLGQDVKDLLDWMGADRRRIWDELERLGQLGSDQNAWNFRDKQTMRVELESSAANLRAGYTLAITVATDQLNGNILAVSSRVETLEAEVNDPVTGMPALAKAVNALDARVIQTESGLAANTLAVQALQSVVNDVSADALFRAETFASPGGGWSRIGLQTRVSTSGNFASAAIFLDAQSNGQSRIVLDAKQLFFGDLSSGSVINPLVYSNGVWAMNVANIGTVNSGLIQGFQNKLRIELDTPRILMAD